MTAIELVRRDYRKAKLNYLRANAKPNTPSEELSHLRELFTLRQKILEAMEAKND